MLHHSISPLGLGNLTLASLAACGILAAFLSGLSRGGFAGSIGLFAVPILSMVMPASAAATVLLPPLFVLDFIVVRYHYAKWDVECLRQILPASAVGLGLGYWLVNTVSDGATAIFMGSTIILASLLRLLKPPHAAPPPGRGASAIKGYLWGGLSGFASFISHAGGAALMIRVLDVMRDPNTIVATVGIVFAINDIVKLVAYAYLGRFNPPEIAMGLGLIPFSIIGYLVGMRYVAKLGASGFQLVSTILLSLAALWMIISGLRTC